jgi:predicted ATPase/class 3 adenylate cyclase
VATDGEFPSGVVTFLFTDLLDSTRQWEASPSDMREAMHRHDELVRRAVSDAGGHVVKSTGDGVMAVFADPTSAVGAAVELQRAILRGSWSVPIRARMGLHTGVAELRDGDYYGTSVNRAARTASAAQPDQILVTSATASLVDAYEFRDVGERQMRGLPPTRVSQVCADGLPSEFAVPVTGRSRVLPAPASSFVGRADEIAVVRAHLEAHRCVTLVGAGGCGKTRLAIEVARGAEPELADGVVFVDLASVTDDDRVAAAVSDALGLTASDGQGDGERVSAFVGGRALLVILDNCEHLLDAVASLAERVLEIEGPSRVLATSREPLSVSGEQVYVVPSLAPEADGFRLFVERASEARGGFAVDDTNRTTVQEITRRLDGIPLAIELAAAAARHLSPAQILERLDDRFRLLTGGRRRVQRHQTLAAALDWSYDLLSEDEQCVLHRLAVFPASFSLEAAEYVVERDDTVERLGSLVDKSLVNPVSDGDRMRYRLLESVRLYAEAKLAGAGESLALRRRHRDWVVQWLDGIPLEERWFGDVDYLRGEHASLRAAIDWSAAEPERGALAQLVSGVDWTRSEAWRDGDMWCIDLAVDEIRTELELQVCMMHWWLGPLRASGLEVLLEPGERALESMPAWDVPHPLHALALTGHGRDLTIEAVVAGDGARRARLTQLVEQGVELSVRFSIGWQKICRLNAGMAYASLSDVAHAEAHFEAGIDAGRGAGSFQLLQSSLEGYLAITRLLNGRLDDALALAIAADERISGALESSAFPFWLHSPGFVLPVALGAAGDEAAARRALVAYHSVMRRTDWRDGLKAVAIVGGALAAERGDWPTAALLISAGSSVIARSPADYLIYNHYRDRIRAALPRDEARVLRAQGRAMPIEDAAALALERS